MKFTKLPIQGAYEIDLTKNEDERGFFARLFCAKEFAAYQLETNFVQCNNSMSYEKGTLRGLHYQLAPKEEVKVVRCLQGALYDLILDLRTDSPTYGQSYGTELSAANRKMLYVPKGCAHGFLTLTDSSELLYLVSEYYSQEHERGIRYDDPSFNIAWPATPLVISERDRCHSDFGSTR